MTLPIRANRVQQPVFAEASVNPILERLPRYFEMLSPFFDSLCLAINGYKITSRYLSVVLLFLACSPANIARLVVAIVVETIQLKVWFRSGANVFHKCLEAMTPFLAYSYAPTAIAMVFGVVFIKASSLHRCEGVIFGQVCGI